MRKDDLWSLFVSKADSDFNWDEWTTDTVSLQSEYTLPAVSRTAYGTKAVHGIAVNYDGNTLQNTGTLGFVTAREVSTNSLKEDWSYYVENQSKDDPIYRVSDVSVFVAPAPVSSEAGTGRLKIIGIRNIKDYTINAVDGAVATTTESEMRIPLDRQKTLVLGVCADMCRFRQKFDDAMKWEAQYIAEKNEYAQQAAQRTATAFYGAYPEDSSTPVNPFSNARI